MPGDSAPTVEDWQRDAATSDIQWTGDLGDDCTAEWSGLTLRAEDMKRADWWWAVYDKRTGTIIGNSSQAVTRVTSGNKARSAAEALARSWIQGTVEALER